jgi:hypothetical protein
MFGSIKTQVNRLRIGRWCWIVALLACLGLPGCAQWDLRGSSFREDDLSGLCRQLRPRETSAEAWGASNKSLQIEKDFGYH